MLSNFMNVTTSSTVTIQWTPPPNADSVMYAIGVAPPPVSGRFVGTSNPQITITVLYNIHYTVNVSVAALCAEVETIAVSLGQ